jgi:hypothetical protein
MSTIWPSLYLRIRIVNSVTFVICLLMAIGFFYAVWPPYRAPDWWRALTRPLRRFVRPHHYR